MDSLKDLRVDITYKHSTGLWEATIEDAKVLDDMHSPALATGETCERAYYALVKSLAGKTLDVPLDGGKRTQFTVPIEAGYLSYLKFTEVAKSVLFGIDL